MFFKLNIIMDLKLIINFILIIIMILI